MQNSDLLQTFAEIGVAFAGFASLLGFLGRSPDQIQKIRLVGMVRAALLATAFSLVPFVPLALGASELTSWRIAAGLFLCVSGTNTFFVWRQLYRTWGRGELKLRVGYFTIPMAAVHLGLAGAASVSNTAASSEGLYVASVAGLLSVSGVLFFGVLTSFVLDLDREPSA